MQITERHIKKVRPGKWSEIPQREEEFDAIERKLGFPPKRHYRYLSGTQDYGTLVMERDWESFAAMESAYDRAMADPQWQALGSSDLYESRLIEYYTPWP